MPPATESPDPVAAWRSMLLAHSRSLRAIEHDLATAGTIPLNWYDVLLELNGAGGQLRMQDLSERVVLSRTRVSRLVSELESEGLLRRKTDPDDARATFAVLTTAGTKALRDTAPIYLTGIDKHFTRHLTQNQQKSIATGLGRVVAAHDPTEVAQQK